ncbi:MAG: cell division protein FtsQ/DivIB [Candidatus Krumholzibacteria bacterium]|nr:cell division protein FtsQ/DivIB [Candidatus Krumholzibacteria bacterium]
MRSAAHKRMAARKKRVRRNLRTRLTMSAMVALLFAAIYVFLWTDLFSLRDVRFLGSSNLPVDSLRVVTADIIGQNLLTISLSGIRDGFMRIPELRDVTFKRRIFHRLDCYIRERDPVALVVSGSVSEIDDEGMIIPRREGDIELDLPVITGVKRDELNTEEGKRKIDSALEVLRLLKSFGFSPAEQLSEIHLDGFEVILVWMRTGTLVHMGEGGYLEKVLKLRAVYGALGGQERFPDLIDLRFDRQVVVR